MRNHVWTDERFAKVRGLIKAAHALTPSLIGLTVGEAQRVLAQHPGLSIGFHGPSVPFSTIGVPERIDATVKNGVVTEAI